MFILLLFLTNPIAFTNIIIQYIPKVTSETNFISSNDQFSNQPLLFSQINTLTARYYFVNYTTTLPMEQV